MFAQKRDVLAARCADIGHDPKEITMSAHLRLEPDRDYGKVLEVAAGLAAEGLDLGIVYISTPHDPAVLEPLAEAIRDSGRWNQCYSGNLRFCRRDNDWVTLSKRVGVPAATPAERLYAECD